MSIATQDRSSNYLENLLAAAGDGEGADLVNFLGKVIAGLKTLDVHNTESDFTGTLATLETDKAANSNFEFLEVIANAAVVLRLLGDGKLQTSAVEPLNDNASALGSASKRFSEVRALNFFGSGANLTDLPSVNLSGSLFRATAPDPLTGTVAVTSASAAVVGTGTLFTTELEVGQGIKINDEKFTVATISDNTNLTLNSNYLGSTDSGISATKDGNLLEVQNVASVTKFALDALGRALGIEFQDDAIITLNAAGTSRKELFKLKNGNGEVVTVQLIGDNVEIDLERSGGSIKIVAQGGDTVLALSDDGIMSTSIGAVPSSVSGGTANAKCLGPSGVFYSSRSGSGTKNHHVFYNDNGGGQVGSIANFGSSTSYNTTSDERLKNFLANLTDEEIDSEFAKAFSVVRVFEWKKSPGKRTLGFGAHAAIDADLLCGLGTEGEGPRDAKIGTTYAKVKEAYVDDDGEKKTRTIEKKVSPASVDQSKLTPLLLLKIEQQERMIKELAARVEALEK